ncbi:hypothetical protein EB796_007490 [Bugula neritina]|uniref:Uncharacterized protein n=1 Tax=Bugula neritina TaxID=10212 RepID=A0A7J7K6G6_BUGNE|nr:hypothetical protein EB796_007490 [Bugula neritina]
MKLETFKNLTSVFGNQKVKSSYSSQNRALAFDSSKADLRLSKSFEGGYNTDLEARSPHPDDLVHIPDSGVISQRRVINNNQIGATMATETMQTDTVMFDDVTATASDVRTTSDDVRAKTDDVTATTDDVTAETSDVKAITNGVRATSDDVTATTDDVTAKSGDVRAGD